MRNKIPKKRRFKFYIKQSLPNFKMKIKINRRLLPIKAHYFFFFAALGPILPQLNVFGRQLGVSPAAMGLVTAVLPLLWALAKPLFGYVADFWPSKRKLIFMMLIAIMSGSYCCLWFLPMPSTTLYQLNQPETIYKLNNTVYLRPYNESTSSARHSCHWDFDNKTFDVYLSKMTDDKLSVSNVTLSNATLSNVTYLSTLYIHYGINNATCGLLSMKLDSERDGDVVCSPAIGHNMLCYDFEEMEDSAFNVSKEIDKESNVEGTFYKTFTFWGFVILMCVGTVAFNVANCIGDAVCFDVLGDEGSKYGAQRAWGTMGYGLTALLGGWLVDLVSGDLKDFTPAFVLAFGATCVDLVSCRALSLPSLSSPSDSGKALRDVLKVPRVLVFIMFAVVAGVFDSFIIYYMFWFLEELAEETDFMSSIKLIEGVTVAAESFGGELLFFFFSGKIINRWGFGTTLTFSLICYGVRMALISVIQNPWHLVFVEGVMQGPTYALCYATIVGYAAAVAPPGYSATVQGIVAGVDDGLGFAIGSLIGGQLYSVMGGRGAFRLFSIVAVIAGVLHAMLFTLFNRKQDDKQTDVTLHEVEKMLPDPNAIYKETVEPVKNGPR